MALLFLLTLLAGSLQARTIDVYPTNTVGDFQAVQNAIASAAPGDTVQLHAGTFNWTGNSAVLPGYTLQVGLPIATSGITISGDRDANGNLLTTIVGPTDSNGLPLLYANNGINGAFINAPGANGFTIQFLNLQNFGCAVAILQDRIGAFSYLSASADWSSGANDVVLQGLKITNSFSGLQASGANDNMIVRDNVVQVIGLNGARESFASGPAVINAGGLGIYNFAGMDAPTNVTFENNVVNGPGAGFDTAGVGGGNTQHVLTGGIFVQGAIGAHVEGNTVQGFTIGIGVAAEQLSVTKNVVSNTQTALRVMDGAGVNANPPHGTTTNALIRNNRLNGNVLLPLPTDIGSASAPLLVCGCGVLTNADGNRYFGNNLENNQVAGIALFGTASTGPALTATGNLIVGNGTLVSGDSAVLSQNTISGSQISSGNPGQVISTYTQSQRPPVE